MGFNARQPGKVKRGDLLYLAAGLIVITALLIWALTG
jgi:hypothetical protein